MVLLLLLCLTPLYLRAGDSITIDMKVLDGQTRKELQGVRVTSMTLDSTIIHAAFSGYEEYGETMIMPFGPTRFVKYACKVKVPGPGEYLLRYDLTGYSTLYKKVKIPTRELGQRVRTWSLGNVYLLPLAVELGEAKVKASKILMVMKGDTLVYNADMLRMAAGSMLENLISALPGVQLNRYGQITVNGRYVERLLLNGKDFFRGDPLVALQNLPSYMVDKVKVYDKAGDDAYLKSDGTPTAFVMDVHLKKQYSIGWIGNVEAGYGTEDRYLGRAIGVSFADESRLSVFGNLNNLNDTRSPGSNGTWSNPTETPRNQLTTKSGGLELLISGDEDWGELLSSLKARREDTHERAVTTKTNYFTSDDTYGRSRYSSDYMHTEIGWDNRLKLKAKQVYFEFSPDVTYTRTRNNGLSQSANFDQDPTDAYRGETLDSLFAPTGSDRLNRFLIHRSENLSRGETEKWKTGGSLYISLPTLYWIYVDNMSIWGRFNREKASDFSRSDIRYGTNYSSEPDFRNYYGTFPSDAYDWGTSITVKARPVGPDDCRFSWNLNYSFRQSYSTYDRSLYRLDHFDGWNSPDGLPFGTLPSTRDSLQQVLDSPNSYHRPRRTKEHNPTFNGALNTKRWGNLSFALKAIARHDWILDRRGGQEQEKSRHFFTLNPSVGYQLKDVTFSYSFTRTAPTMSDLLDLRDNTNPLNLWLSNPALKSPRQHSFQANIAKSRRKDRFHDGGNIRMRYNLYLSSIGQALTYDRTTGTYITQPRNANGNWDASIDGTYSRSLGKGFRGWLYAYTRLYYRNSVDFAWVTDDAGNGRSSVRNLRLTENIKGSYNFDNIRLEGHAQAIWAYATSPRADFATMSSVDFQYGLKTTIHLPWDLEIATDITMYSRRGYDDASMNTDDLVWNLRLSKSMLPKRNLVLSLDGFDILGQLSDVRRTVDSQGRTETWYNTVPRYFMARIAYRLNIAPKKNKTIGNKTAAN